MLQRQVRVDQISSIDGHAGFRRRSWEIVRIEHIARDPERFQVFPEEYPLCQGDCVEAARRYTRERRESTGNFWRAEPAVGRQREPTIEGDGGFPRIRILHNGPVFDNQIGGAYPRTRRSSVRFRSAGMPVDRRDTEPDHHMNCKWANALTVLRTMLEVSVCFRGP